MKCKKSMSTVLALAVAANATGVPVRAEGKSFLERIEALENANWNMMTWHNALNNLGDLPDDVEKQTSVEEKMCKYGEDEENYHCLAEKPVNEITSLKDYQQKEAEPLGQALSNNKRWLSNAVTSFQRRIEALKDNVQDKLNTVTNTIAETTSEVALEGVKGQLITLAVKIAKLEGANCESEGLDDTLTDIQNQFDDLNQLDPCEQNNMDCLVQNHEKMLLLERQIKGAKEAKKQALKTRLDVLQKHKDRFLKHLMYAKNQINDLSDEHKGDLQSALALLTDAVETATSVKALGALKPALSLLLATLDEASHKAKPETTASC